MVVFNGLVHRIIIEGCTSIGGKKEMKKRIEIMVKNKMLVSTFAAFLVLVLSVTGCTFSNGQKEAKTETVAEVETKADENMTTERKEKQEIEREEQTEEPEQTEELEKTEKPLRTTPISASLEKKWEDVPVGAYCLSIRPNELCFDEDGIEGVDSGANFFYYVPDEKKQKKIQKLLKHPEKKEKMATRLNGYVEYAEQWIKEHNRTVEAEFSLAYKADEGDFMQVNEDGAIEKGNKVMVNPKLVRYLAKILKDELQYEPLDVTTIKNIESVTLEYVHPMTKKQYSQTIKEKVILDKFEDWFSHAKACYSGDFPWYTGLLTLQLKNGKEIKLTMANGISCFSANGELYDYDPKLERKRSGYEFFECFDEIPYYNHYYNSNRVNATQKRKIKKLCKNFTKFLCRELVAEGTIIRLEADNTKTWKFQDWKKEDTTYKENMLASLKDMDCKNAAEKVFDIKDWDVTPALEDYGNVRLSMSIKSIRKVSSKRYKAIFHIEWENSEKIKKIRSATFTLKKKKGTYYGFVVKSLTMKKTAK